MSFSNFWNHSFSSDKLNEDVQVTFAFNFFLHGDSNVCANVDVRQHLPVSRINTDDMDRAQYTSNGIKVILAPYGLEGYLTGFVYKESDPSVQKFLADWKKIYPLSTKNDVPATKPATSAPTAASTFINKVVEVIIGDYKMKYPVYYIFISQADRQCFKAKLALMKTLESTIGGLNGNKSSQSFQQKLQETFERIQTKSNECLQNNQLVMTPFFNEMPKETYCLTNITNQIMNFCDHLQLDSSAAGGRKIKHEYEHGSLLQPPAFLADLHLKKVCHCTKCTNVMLKKQAKLNGTPMPSSSKSFKMEKIKLLKGTPYHHRPSLNINIGGDGSQAQLPHSFVGHNHGQLSSGHNSAHDSSASVSKGDSLLLLLNQNHCGTTSSNSHSSTVPTPSLPAYKSPVSSAGQSSACASLLNTPGVINESQSPLSNLNCDQNGQNGGHSSSLAIASLKSEHADHSMNTPNNMTHPSPKEGLLNGALNCVGPYENGGHSLIGDHQHSNQHGMMQQPQHLNNHQFPSNGDPAHSLNYFRTHSKLPQSEHHDGHQANTESYRNLSYSSVLKRTLDQHNFSHSSFNLHQMKGPSSDMLMSDDFELIDFRRNKIYDFTMEPPYEWGLSPPKNRRLPPISHYEELYDLYSPIDHRYYDSMNISYEFYYSTRNTPFSDRFYSSLSAINFDDSYENSGSGNLKQEYESSCSRTVPSNTNSLINHYLNSPEEHSNDKNFLLESLSSTTGQPTSNQEPSTLIESDSVYFSSLSTAAELSRMFPTPPSLEAMVCSPLNGTNNHADAVKIAVPHDKVEVHSGNAKQTKQMFKEKVNNSSNNLTKLFNIKKESTDNGDSSEDWSYVYRSSPKSAYSVPNKYAPLDLQIKSPLPPNLFYRHNSNPNRLMKGAGGSLSVPNLQYHSTNSLNVAKFKFSSGNPGFGGSAVNKMGGFPNSMIRNVRPHTLSGGNSVLSGPHPLVRHIRPLTNGPHHLAHPHLYNNTSEGNNFGHFRPHRHQVSSSPGFSLDHNGPGGASAMSPMPNSFISSPASTGSPFLFHQNSLNSPSALNSPSLNSASSFPKMSPLVPNIGPAMTPVTPIYQPMVKSISDHPIMIDAMFAESNSLYLNLLLSDSMLNVFRDHNFESCSICVCNMNIKGNDVGIYLPDTPGAAASAASSDCFPCQCGFSAISNRYLSQHSGLFCEDETEIANAPVNVLNEKSRVDRSIAPTSERSQVDGDLKKLLTSVDEGFMNILIEQSLNIFANSSTLSRIIHLDSKKSKAFKTFDVKDTSKKADKNYLRLLYKDCSELTLISLKMSRVESVTGPAGPPGSTPNASLMPCSAVGLTTSRPVLHDWSFRRSNYPVNNHQVVYMLQTLQPLLQESVQRKGSINEVTYNKVKGPLTWRQFHRLSGRGTECQCEPQPIPLMLAGYDKDCVVLSPFSLRFWEKLSLEPYAITRDVAYVVLVPSDDNILYNVKNYFKELSTTYELLRLGRHAPLSKLFVDGICPISSSLKKKDVTYPLDEWFTQFGDSSLARSLKLFAQACFNLIPKFSSYDKTLFEQSGSGSKHDSSSSTLGTNHMGSNTPMNGVSGNSYMPNAYTSQQSSGLLDCLHGTNNGGNSKTTSLESNISHIRTVQNYDEMDNIHRYPGIVIYIVEPFTSMGVEVGRLGCCGLLKSCAQMLAYIPEALRNNVHFQLISLASIMGDVNKDYRGYHRQSQLKETCFSVYSLCKQQLILQPTIKSLTGLGPAALLEVFLKSKDLFYNMTQLYTTPFILAPHKEKHTDMNEMFGERKERTQILYVSYCLTDDQKWMLVSCTNDKGDMLQATVIRIHVPNRPRRRSAPIRRHALDKLMKFVMTVMSESAMPWRLVIGRLGRVGHGELKDWTFLLSKKALLKYSRQLKEMCGQCRELTVFDQPAVYSACLISLEADTSLRVFPNYYTPDERFSSSCNTCSLSTPEDATCTHILVFPTSATTQSSHNNFSMMDNDEFFSDIGEDIQGEDGIEFFDNLWNDPMLGSNGEEHQVGSPNSGNRQSGFGNSNSLKVNHYSFGVLNRIFNIINFTELFGHA